MPGAYSAILRNRVARKFHTVDAHEARLGRMRRRVHAWSDVRFGGQNVNVIENNSPESAVNLRNGYDTISPATCIFASWHDRAY